MWYCEDKLNRKTAHFRLLSVPQKRRLPKLPIVGSTRVYLWTDETLHISATFCRLRTHLIK